MSATEITCTVNGRAVRRTVPDRLLLRGCLETPSI